MKPIEKFKRVLNLGETVDSFSCHCPGHDDQHKSLSVAVGDYDRLLLYCHAGCDLGRIMASAGLKVSDAFNESRIENWDNVYDYTDENGILKYQVIRFANKDFLQRRPSGMGDWIWKMKGQKRYLYRLPRVKKAIIQKKTVCIVAGEKDVHTAERLGLIATTNSGGEGKFKTYAKDLVPQLEGASMLIVFPDNDEAGQKHSQDVLELMAGKVGAIKVVNLPVKEKGEDFTDYIEKYGGTIESITELVHAMPTHQSADDLCINADDVFQDNRRQKSIESDSKTDISELADDADDADDHENSQLVSSAADQFLESQNEGPKQRLVALVLDKLEKEGCKYLRTEDRQAYIYIPEFKSTYPVPSNTFYEYLSYFCYQRLGNVPSSEMLKKIISVITFQAKYDGEKVEVFQRVACVDNKIYLDLNDEHNHVVEISESGWQLLDYSPGIYWKRLDKMLPIPEPQRGGSIHDLKKIVNLKGESVDVLYYGSLLGLFLTNGTYPIVSILGGPGSGKSWGAWVFTSLIDPCAAKSVRLPKKEEDFFVAGLHSFLLSYENVSEISDEMQDSLCSYASGSGFSKRTAYSNSDQTILLAKGAVVLNGINPTTNRTDAADRTVSIVLHELEETESEWRIGEEFDKLRPGILGSLLDAVSTGLRNIERVRADKSWKRHRLADFVEWVRACESGLGYREGTFMKVFTGQQEADASLNLENGPVCVALHRFAKEILRNGYIIRDDEGILSTIDHFEGSATLLRNELLKHLSSEERKVGFPKAANALTGQLRRDAKPIRQLLNIEMDLNRRMGPRKKKRGVYIKPLPIADDDEKQKFPRSSASSASSAAVWEDPQDSLFNIENSVLHAGDFHDTRSSEDSKSSSAPVEKGKSIGDGFDHEVNFIPTDKPPF